MSLSPIGFGGFANVVFDRGYMQMICSCSFIFMKGTIFELTYLL